MTPLLSMFADQSACIHNLPHLLLLLLLSYFHEMERILSADYMPTQDDVLRSRVQTTGIIETTFRVGKLTYR